MPPQAPAVEDLGPIQVEDLGPIDKTETKIKEPEKKPLSLKERVQQAQKDAAKQFSDTNKATTGAIEGAIFEGERRVQSLAAPIRKKLGMQPATPPPEPTTTPEKVGAGAEQAAEFFVPGMVSKKMGVLGKVATEGSGAYAIAKAQGDPHPLWAAALSTVLAPLGALEKAAPGVRASAERSMGKALSQGQDVSKKAVQKAINQSIPRALDLGISATWQKLLSKAGAVRETAGEAVKATVAGPEGQKVVHTQPVIDALDAIKTKVQNVVPIGKLGQPIGAGAGAGRSQKAVVFNKSMVKKVDELKKIIEAHGPTMTAQQLHNIKEDWNEFVASAGGFAGKKVKLEAKAKKAAVGAMREVLLSDAPTISAVDKAYSLSNRTYETIANAAGVGKLSATERNVSTQTTRAAREIGRNIGAAVGTGAGYYAGHSTTSSLLGGVLGGVTGDLLERAMRSPGWKLLRPTVKNQIAEALAAGRAEQVRRLVAPLIASEAAGSNAR